MEITVEEAPAAEEVEVEEEEEEEEDIEDIRDDVDAFVDDILDRFGVDN